MDEFMPELGRYILRALDTFDDDHKAMNRALRVGTDLRSTLSRVAATEFRYLQRSRRWLLELELVVRYCDDEAFAQSAREGYRDLDDIDGMIYAKALRRHGYRFARPWTNETAYRSIQALLEGAMLRTLVDPDAGFGSTRSDEGSYARTVVAFVSNIIEPLDES
ncbi:MAG: hypothetical protein WEC34_15665 [Acidimicrobiia bacterium]